MSTTTTTEAIVAFLTAEATMKALKAGNMERLSGLVLPAERTEAEPLVIKAVAVFQSLTDKKAVLTAKAEKAGQALKTAMAMVKKYEEEERAFESRGVSIPEERAEFLKLRKGEETLKARKASKVIEECRESMEAISASLAVAPALPALVPEDVRKADLLRTACFGDVLPFDGELMTAFVKAVRAFRECKPGEQGRKTLKENREKALCDLLAYYGGGKCAKVNNTEAEFISTWLLPSVSVTFVKTSKNQEVPAFLIGMKDSMDGKAFAVRLAKVALMKVEGVKATPENVALKAGK